MKTKLILTVLCVLMVSITSFAHKKGPMEITGNSSTEFGSYQIVMSSNPMVLNNEAVKTYDLTYGNTVKTIRIGVVPSKKCINFIVKSDIFEIEYVCNKGVFGVKKLNSDYLSIKRDVNDGCMNRAQYFAQRIISQNPKTEEELLGLIACYFPQLINEDYLAKF